MTIIIIAPRKSPCQDLRFFDTLLSPQDFKLSRVHCSAANEGSVTNPPPLPTLGW